MAAEVYDAGEWPLGKGAVEGGWGFRPSLHASAVLGLSLIPCDSSFQSRIADLMRGSRWRQYFIFRMVFFSLPSFLPYTITPDFGGETFSSLPVGVYCLC